MALKGNIRGPAGAAGAAGAAGTNGTNGTNGAPGAVWYEGTTVPAGGLGIDGDFYLRTTTGDVYQKAAGVWGIIGNIMGPTGPAGTNGTNGTDGTNGTNGAAGATGPAGGFGGAVTLEFFFNSGTTNTDPSSGHVALNNNPENGSTAMRISNFDINGVDVSAIVNLFDDSTNSPAGYLRLVNKTDPTQYIIFTNGAVSVGGASYKNVLVAAIASNATSPFSSGDHLLLCWDRSGDMGATGATGGAGPAGTNGTNGSTWLQGSTVPASGLGTNGDFYLRVSTGDVYQKAAGAWGSPIENLVGPTGPAGPAGTGGTSGTNGTNGPGYVSGGRLTLTTGVPYLLADSTTAQTTLFFTPAIGDTVLLYDGTSLNPTTFTEVSQTLADTTKSPAAAAANSVYDIFAWSDAGTFRISRGPAWTTSVLRSAGTALVRAKGVLLNNSAITNGPGAQRGTYLGTIATDASTKMNMSFKIAASTGGGNRLDVWNLYNRELVCSINIDTTASWTYSTAAWIVKNNSLGNLIAWVQGLDDIPVNAVQQQHAQQANAALIAIGFGVDSTTVLDSASPTATIPTTVAGKVCSDMAEFNTRQAAGQHYISPLLFSTASGITTWYGSTTLGTGLVPVISTFTLRLFM